MTEAISRPELPRPALSRLRDSLEPVMTGVRHAPQRVVFHEGSSSDHHNNTTSRGELPGGCGRRTPRSRDRLCLGSQLGIGSNAEAARTESLATSESEVPSSQQGAIAADVSAPLEIEIPGGQTITLPAELGVDIVGGSTGVLEAVITISIPGGQTITLPAELGEDLVGGSTGVGGSTITIMIPGWQTITLPSELGVDLVGGSTGVAQ